MAGNRKQFNPPKASGKTQSSTTTPDVSSPGQNAKVGAGGQGETKKIKPPEDPKELKDILAGLDQQRAILQEMLSRRQRLASDAEKKADPDPFDDDEEEKVETQRNQTVDRSNQQETPFAPPPPDDEDTESPEIPIAPPMTPPPPKTQNTNANQSAPISGNTRPGGPPPIPTSPPRKGPPVIKPPVTPVATKTNVAPPIPSQAPKVDKAMRPAPPIPPVPPRGTPPIANRAASQVQNQNPLDHERKSVSDKSLEITIPEKTKVKVAEEKSGNTPAEELTAYKAGLEKTLREFKNKFIETAFAKVKQVGDTYETIQKNKYSSGSFFGKALKGIGGKISGKKDQHKSGAADLDKKILEGSAEFLRRIVPDELLLIQTRNTADKSYKYMRNAVEDGYLKIISILQDEFEQAAKEKGFDKEAKETGRSVSYLFIQSLNEDSNTGKTTSKSGREEYQPSKANSNYYRLLGLAIHHLQDNWLNNPDIPSSKKLTEFTGFKDFLSLKNIYGERFSERVEPSIPSTTAQDNSSPSSSQPGSPNSSGPDDEEQDDQHRFHID